MKQTLNSNQNYIMLTENTNNEHLGVGQPPPFVSSPVRGETLRSLSLTGLRVEKPYFLVFCNVFLLCVIFSTMISSF